MSKPNLPVSCQQPFNTYHKAQYPCLTASTIKYNWCFICTVLALFANPNTNPCNASPLRPLQITTLVEAVITRPDSSIRINESKHELDFFPIS
ncbi:uncharacterized protein A1O5_10176 [Cladophialophora psammophila CBS 110553]|uniref:Uncharacterized protein n=1 Tax=Cladophialophora psammophila CBS 110553 TaxID=1182543 RepID=W9WEG0_9EURO|nr:uncharacterized protein A1O5_10176 [Cladophialophora psammophila CBS 110553]EXJ66507.1 hypothetical protein A1O5_10176 [Cladophialophora psammophila CBS 110553]